MRENKEQAIVLRKLGKSYQEIREEFGIPKSTLSDWFRNQEWSREISAKLFEQMKDGHIVRLRELNKVRGKNLKRLYEEAKVEAITEFEKFKYHPLFIAGLMIYWGEGNKVSRSRCGIANTEPLMIEVFLHFLRNICGFESPRIRAWILVYPDLNEIECKDYWVRSTSLKSTDFTKSIMIKGKHRTNKLSFGVCSIGVSSAYLKCKILKWIELLAIDLVRGNYYADMV